MKTIIELTTGRGNFLAVMVPEVAKDIEIYSGISELVYYIGVEHFDIALPDDGEYELIGPIKDLTEEQMFQVLSLDKFSVKQKLHQEERNSMYWVVVNGKRIHFDTKAQAQDFAIRMEFKSLCEANNIPEHALLIKVIQ